MQHCLAQAYVIVVTDATIDMSEQGMVSQRHWPVCLYLKTRISEHWVHYMQL